LFDKLNYFYFNEEEEKAKEIEDDFLFKEQARDEEK
jgi:hypothetical protein